MVGLSPSRLSHRLTSMTYSKPRRTCCQPTGSRIVSQNGIEMSPDAVYLNLGSLRDGDAASAMNHTIYQPTGPTDAT